MSKIKIKYTCALVLANDLIGGKWKLRILWHIAHGDNRFSLLTKAIPDISQKVLTVQLKELEEKANSESHEIKELVADIVPTYHIRPEDKVRDRKRKDSSETFQEFCNLGKEEKTDSSYD